MFCLPLCGEDMVGLETQNRWVERQLISDVAGGHKNRQEGGQEEERQRDREKIHRDGNEGTHRNTKEEKKRKEDLKKLQ